MDDTAPIYVYTRAQAIADGVLIDASETAHEAGFAIPVALTKALWDDIEAIPERYQGIQDVAGRLWDVLWMGYLAARTHPTTTDPLCYQVIMRVEGSRKSCYSIKMVIGPGDGGEPVLTLMKPEED